MNLTNAQATAALKAATKGINAAFAASGRFVDPDTALDLAQESICNLIASFDPAKATANGVDGLAYVIGKREAMDYLRGRVSGGAQRRHDGEDSITVADEDGNPTDLEIASPWPSAFDQYAALQRDTALNAEISALPESQKRALRATIADEDHSDGANRVAKMRAIDTIVSNLPKSMRGTAGRSKAKGKKRK